MTASHSTSINDAVSQLDDQTTAIFISCPSVHIVQLQSYFEIFESVGVVRTLDSRSSKVCILTTPSMFNDCIEILEGLSGKVPWQYVPTDLELFKKLQD